MEIVADTTDLVYPLHVGNSQTSDIARDHTVLIKNSLRSVLTQLVWKNHYVTIISLSGKPLIRRKTGI